MIKLALFGAGRIGKIHGHNVALNPQAELVALHDPYQVNADHLSAALGCKQMTPEQIFSDPSITGILVCSATDTHADLIEQAVLAGKHVFCEKPIDLSLARVQQVVDKVNASPITTMLAFNRRFDSNFALLQQRIASGEIGDVELVSIISKDPSPPPVDYIKVSGGLFRDMTIHDFDMARFMISSKVISIFAVGRNLVDPNIGIAGDIDTAVVTITFDSGAIATIDNSRQAVYGYDQRVEVFGSEGMAGTENNKSDNHYYYNKKGQSESLPLHFFMDRYIPSYFNEMKAFIHCIVHDEVPKVGGQDGLISLAMGWAANTSMQENRVVMLKEMLN